MNCVRAHGVLFNPCKSSPEGCIIPSRGLCGADHYINRYFTACKSYSF